MNFKIIDTGIMDGFETLTRLGGYIMFSMIASLLQKLPIPHILTLILAGMVEMTNGIAMLPDSGLPKSTQYVLAVVYTDFGGLSGIAQTSSMIRDTPLSIKRYCIAKLLLAACCGLLACLVSGFSSVRQCVRSAQHIRRDLHLRTVCLGCLRIRRLGLRLLGSRIELGTVRRHYIQESLQGTYISAARLRRIHGM